MLTDERIHQIFYPLGTATENQKLIARACARAIEAEVRAEAQEPVAIVVELYEQTRSEVMAKGYSIGAYLYTAPQPPAPCHDYGTCDECGSPYSYDPRDKGSICVPCMMQKSNALQAKVDEQCEWRDERITVLAQGYEDQVAAHNKTLDEFAQQAERIAELEKQPTMVAIREMIEAQCVVDNAAVHRKMGEQSALIEKCEKQMKEVHKYVRVEFEWMLDVALEAIAAHRSQS